MNSRPALQTGSFELLDSPPEVFCFRRQAAEQPEIRVALNFSASPAAVSFPNSGRIAVSTDPRRVPGPAAGGELILGQNEGVIVEYN